MNKLKRGIALACMVSVGPAFGFSAWNEKNRPELMEFNYETEYSKLSKYSILEKKPWSGDYWPTFKGGITFRWNKKNVQEDEEKYGYDFIDTDDLGGVKVEELSPAEKYDLFLGNKNLSLTKYERKRTNIMKTVEGSSEYDSEFEIPKWEGLCHAWAPAAHLYDNPAPVTVKNKNGVEIKFGSSDIKALLTYHLHLNNKGKTNFLGSRCNLDFKELNKKRQNGEITKEEFLKKINSQECEDTNAGAFHIVLTNQIAEMKKSFIIDKTRDSEVWNQPVVGFSVKEIENKSGASAGSAPGTVREITVETQMLYIVEVPQSMDKQVVGMESGLLKKALNVENYKYKLEINDKGEIVGGEWISVQRPDFLWKRTAPKFSGYMAKLKEIYEKSVTSTGANVNEDEERRRLEEEERLRREEEERVRREEEERTRRGEEERRREEERRTREEEEARRRAEEEGRNALDWHKVEVFSYNVEKDVTHLYKMIGGQFGRLVTLNGAQKNVMNTLSSAKEVATHLKEYVRQGNRESAHAKGDFKNLLLNLVAVRDSLIQLGIDRHIVQDFNKMVKNVQSLIGLLGTDGRLEDGHTDLGNGNGNHHGGEENHGNEHGDDHLGGEDDHGNEHNGDHHEVIFDSRTVNKLIRESRNLALVTKKSRLRRNVKKSVYNFYNSAYLFGQCVNKRRNDCSNILVKIEDNFGDVDRYLSDAYELPRVYRTYRKVKRILNQF